MHGGSSLRKLNMNSALRRQTLRNLTTELIKHGRLETTLPRAKELRRLADKMITLGKRGTEHDRHQIEAYVFQHKKVVPILMDTYAKRFAARPGGFTRVIPIGHRKGDYAPMAMIEILNTDEPMSEVNFSYLVRSLASLQLKEATTNTVENALSPPAISKDTQTFADKREYKRALAELKSREKFAYKLTRAIKNAGITNAQMQYYVDADVARVKELNDKESCKKLFTFVQETWPENTPSLN